MRDTRELSDEELVSVAKDASVLVYRALKEIREQQDALKAEYEKKLMELEERKSRISIYYGAAIQGEMRMRKDRYNKAIQAFEGVKSEIEIPEGVEREGVLEKMLQELKARDVSKVEHETVYYRYDRDEDTATVHRHFELSGIRVLYARKDISCWVFRLSSVKAAKKLIGLGKLRVAVDREIEFLPYSEALPANSECE